MNKTLQAKETISKHISRQRMARQFRLPAERVLAEQLGYSRATIGKALGVLEGEGVILRKKGSGTFIAGTGKERTMTIALVMRAAYHYTDMHFRLIVEEVSKYAEKNNIYIQIFDRLSDMFKSDPYNNPLMQGIKNGTIDGVLIASRMPSIVISQIANVCPAVSINNIFGEGNEIPCISCDYFRTGFLAGKYLQEQGHRKIAYVTSTLNHAESTMEYSGFTCALESTGIEISDENTLESGYNTKTFQSRTAKFFTENDYTAVFVRSSLNANRILTFLQKQKIKVPENFTVIATGNYKNNANVSNKVVLIDNHLNKMCKLGIETLNNLMTGKKCFTGLKLISPTIIGKAEKY